MNKKTRIRLWKKQVKNTFIKRKKIKITIYELRKIHPYYIKNPHLLLSPN